MCQRNAADYSAINNRKQNYSNIMQFIKQLFLLCADKFCKNPSERDIKMFRYYLYTSKGEK